ncbi:sulfatase-like hydrolase/transferase [Chloroflexota bacterium]
MGNILLISKEILRKDYIGCYGGKHFDTPNIDKLAEKGTIFTNYYTAAPSTAMAVTCMFTGLNAYELDRRSYTEVEQFTQVPTLFSVLEEGGYETHVIWPQYQEHMTWKYSKIFDSGTKIHNLPSVATHILAISHVGRDNTVVVENPEDTITNMKFYQEMMEVIKAARKPVFIWMHCPHVFNPRTCVGSDIDLFDELVGKLMDSFDGNIYLTADHGGMLGEKGAFGYGFSVYEGVANIPLITPFLGRKVVDEPTSSIQLKSIILEDRIYPQEYVYSDTQYYEQPLRRLMIRKGDFKYIYNKKNKTEELYDLRYDPNENINLLFKERREPDRKLIYLLNQIYYYPRWDEAERICFELREQKDRIWRSGNPLLEWLMLIRDNIVDRLPLWVIKIVQGISRHSKLVRRLTLLR